MDVDAHGLILQCWARTHAVKKSVRNEEDVLRAVQIVHTMIDREIAAGTDPGDVFVFGLSQGGSRNRMPVFPFNLISISHVTQH